MNRFLLWLPLCLVALFSHAQVEWQHEVKYSESPLFEKKGLHYKWDHPQTYPKAPFYRYDLNVYDASDKLLNTFKYSGNKAITLEAGLTGEGFMAFHINQPEHQTILVIDDQGQKLKEEHLDRENSWVNEAYFTVKGSNIYFISAVKEKRKGFKVECFDKEMKLVWEHLEMPEKGRNNFSRLIKDEKGFTMMYDYKKNAVATPQPHLMFLSYAGQRSYNKVIEDLPSSLKVRRFTQLKSGSTILVGTYNSTTSSSKEKMGDVLYVQFSPSGNETKRVNLADLDLSSVTIREEIPVRIDKKRSTIGLYPVGIVERHNGVELLCESYVYTPTYNDETMKVTSARFYNMDLYSILINDAEPTITRMAKPYRATEITEGVLIDRDNATGRIGSSFSHEHNRVYYITSWHNGYPYLGFIYAGDEYEAVEERVYLSEKPVSGLWFEGNITGGNYGSGAGILWRDDHYIIYQKSDDTVFYSKFNYKTPK